MTESKHVDHLSRLPPELIQQIFDEQGAEERASTVPLSKKLLPFQQRALYRVVSLKSYDQLNVYCRTARGDKSLMRYTVELRVEIRASYSGPNSDQTPFIESQDPLAPTNGEVTRLFKRLRNVKHLTMKGSTRLATLLLTRDVSTTSLPRLEVLELASAFSDVTDPFHPSNYSNLPNYSDLEELSLAVWRNARTIQATTRETFEPSLLSDSMIISVILYGPLSSSESSVRALLSSFDRLVTLTLNDQSPTSKMYDLLDALQSPEDLELLCLRRFSDPPSPPNGSFTNLLVKFTSLDYLGLDGTSAPLFPEFYSSLNTIPLQDLSFGYDADINLVELTKLISGTSKHKSLQEVSFDNVEAARSMSGLGWFMPNWTENFNPGTLRDFLEVASAEGIRISGKALEALKIEDGFTGETYLINESDEEDED